MAAAAVSRPGAAVSEPAFGVVFDSLSNIQAMGLTNRHYAISVSNDGSEGMLLYDADGDFSQGSQVVAHLSGSLNALHKSNISFA